MSFRNDHKLPKVLYILWATLFSCWWVLNILSNFTFHCLFMIQKKMWEVIFFISRESLCWWTLNNTVSREGRTIFKLLYSLHLSTTKVKLMKASFGLLLKILQVKYVKSSKGLNGYGPHLVYFSLDVSCLFAQTVHSVGFYFKLLLKTNLHQHLGEGSAHMDLEVGFHCLNTGICFHLRWQALSETKLADTK